MYTELVWDSQFFEIKVGKINDSNVSFKVLKEILNQAKIDNFKLLYWSSKSILDPQKLEEVKGLFVDKKMTLEVSLTNKNMEFPLDVNIIQEYDVKFKHEIEELAIQSGESSRYAIDQHISKEKFQLLYKIWIRKSIAGILAEKVLVSLDNDILTGMITIDSQNKRGNIGLIAVKKNFRGCKYGEMLVKSAHKYFIENNCSISRVVTQGMNIASVNFYKKCGYLPINQEFFYHFWL